MDRYCPKLGYKYIVLMGHIIEYNKGIYYLSKYKVKELKSVILVCLPNYTK